MAPESPSSNREELPRQIGRYRVVSQLGKGGFGIVFLAEDDQLHRQVAVKVPHRDRISRPADAEAYLAEARIVAALDHPNIVPVHDAGSTDEFPCFIVSRYIEGCTLAQRMAQARLTVGDAVQLVATVAETLHHAHLRGLVHRDVKPANILLDSAGKPYVADFGLALKDENVGRGLRMAGTPAYMSPEQARGEGHRVDGRSDICSLGVVFYELLAGRRPFHADSRDEMLQAVATQEPWPLRQIDAAIPRELERICLKALAKRAADRYLTAQDMADDLRHWLATPATPPQLPAVAVPRVLEPPAPPRVGLGKDVFLSYATPDREAAFRFCKLLEDQRIGCWIAPRDVAPGADYGEAIIRAIESTAATLLLLSAHANASIHVAHELERATSKRRRVIPVRLEDVEPGPSLELHLATAHRVDAWRLAPEHLAAELARAIRSESAGPTPTPTTPASDDRPMRIVPKGLRSFDARDADFFLELLPGPRDRDGLPDSLRFWKARIEERDADSTFAVGLIYGPSGCGKSSLVKAGLLPRLAEDVIAVYVEATAEETEARLLHGLRKRCPGLPASLGLKETLAALRVGQAALPVPGEGQARLPVPRPPVGQAALPVPGFKKLLIVLDQFEQWLHAKRDAENTELVQALRQCDGGRVQCVVMVRDDFWLATSRFMRELEVRLVEGHNSALVDLFPLRHAEKVLMAFGRAFGALPESGTEIGKEQQAFLEQALRGLAQDSKVICVRLALFAEMMKGKPWTPATLKAVGGTEGVGATFLEETFSAATAPPEHRYHQKAAGAVLRALLPESGTEIKGHMRGHAELLAASGYAGRPKEFDELVRILDGEIRLITPTEAAGAEAELAGEGQARLPVLRGEPPAVGQAALPVPRSAERFYQLTHDYLVPSLRDWLTRKQKETRRGRAALLLADRAAVWNGRPENRQLPSLWQWASIRFWTRTKAWTAPQRKMMRKARRYHLTRALMVAVLLTAGAWTGVAIWSRTHAAGLVKGLMNAEMAQVPELLNEIDGYRSWAEPLLREEYDNAPAESPQKLHAALALLRNDPAYRDYVYRRLLDAAPQEIKVVRDALLAHAEALQDGLWQVVEHPPQDKPERRLRATCALAGYDPSAGANWQKAAVPVAEDVLAAALKNPSHYPVFLELLRPVGASLVDPLATVFRNPGRSEAERLLATSLLAEFAAQDAGTLADLLMDADDKQFAVLYPGVKEHGDRSVSVLVAEIDKQRVAVADKKVLRSKGTIDENDVKVKVSQGDVLAAKRFPVALQAGKKYRLTMDSQDLDSFLVLQDKNGKELAFDHDSGGNLNSLLVYDPPADDTYTVFAASLKGTGSFVLTIVEAAGDDGKERLAKRQANAAVALLKMNQPAKVWPLLKHSRDPRARSYLIHRLAPLGAEAAVIVKRFDVEPDVTIRRALLLSLGGFGDKEFALDGRKVLLPKLQDIYRTAPDSGLHASAEWLLRSWKQDAWLREVNEKWQHDGEQREERLEGIRKNLASRAALAPGDLPAPGEWYVNGQGQTMVVIPGPVEFLMGSPLTEAGRQDYEPQHKKRIERTFAIAAKSVTVEQYRKFDPSYQLPAMYTRRADLPVVGTSWYRAAAYCNWLSKKEELAECYEVNAAGQVTKLKANYLSLAGYRLPTEAEMEYATRAGALTSRYYGETEELLPKYAWYLKNSDEQTWPVGSLKPNDFGLFDVQGNVFAWCQEKYLGYPATGNGQAVDDKEYTLDINTDSRVLRGGSFNYLASTVRSANRYSYAPATRLNFVGLRPARTFTP